MSTLSTSNSSNANRNFFIEPFYQGFNNIHDGFTGRRTERAAQNALNSPAFQERNLSLMERVSAFVIGGIFLIPIINYLVLAILKSFSSSFVYLGAPSNAANLNNTNIVPENSITPEEMIERKTLALERLTGLEEMIPANASRERAITTLSDRFELDAQILNFNLDALLQRYQTRHVPNKLREFIDWSATNEDRISTRERAEFTHAINIYNDTPALEQQQFLVKTLMSNLAEYFVQQRQRVVQGSDAETALKEQFRRVCRSIIDANNNCVDQMLSQLQMLVLDVLAEGDAIGQARTLQAKVRDLTSLALCQYRSNLLKEILIRQNHDQHHMADLERMAMQRVAQALGLQGAIFNAGALFANMLGNVDEPIANAVDVFLNEYKPLEYLLKDLSTYHGNRRVLRSEMCLWARSYFAFENEDPNNPTSHDMDRRISDNFDEMSASEGGNMKIPAVALYLESLGIIQQR